LAIQLKDLVAEVDVESHAECGFIVKLKVALPDGATLAIGIPPSEASALALAIDKAADECLTRLGKTPAPQSP
jgi:hypothetical protein